jgi:hypothetical protein
MDVCRVTGYRYYGFALWTLDGRFSIFGFLLESIVLADWLNIGKVSSDGSMDPLQCIAYHVVVMPKCAQMSI